jgi:hypothetical protein
MLLASRFTGKVRDTESGLDYLGNSTTVQTGHLATDMLNTMTQSNELPTLTPEQLKVLRRFASLDASVEDVRRSLAGVFEVNLEPEVRAASTHFRVPEPGVTITRDHISKALEQKRLGLISERELVYWATMLLLNDAFEIDPNDEDFIAGWLNDISYNLDPT